MGIMDTLSINTIENKRKIAYDMFNKLKENCISNTENVIPIDDVPKDARNDYNLKTKQELLDFITNDGLENLKYINTKDWEKNPDTTCPIDVYAFEFRTMFKLGYIAFMYNQKTNKWLIKSFHLSGNMNKTMFNALKGIKLEREDKND